MTSSPTAQPGVGERQGYIGGSDLAGILSLSPYSTPFQVFAAKVGTEVTQAHDPVREEKFYWGHALEPLIAEAFSKRHGIPVQRTSQAFYRHAQHQYMGAHLDFEVPNSRVVVECKNVEYEFSKDWGEPNEIEHDSSSLVPLYYLCQVDHYMIVRDAPFAYLCALFGGCKLKVYRIDRSAERDEIVLRAEALFWQRVLNDDPPPFSGVDDMLAAIRSGYIESYNSKRAKAEKIKIQLDETGVGLLSVVQSERKKEKQAKERVETARLALIEHLQGKTGYLYVGKEKQGSFLTHERENFDDFSFSLAHPEIKEQFTTKAIVGPVLRLSKDFDEESKDG